MSRVTLWFVLLAGLATTGLIGPLAQAGGVLTATPGLTQLQPGKLVSLGLPVTREDQIRALTHGPKAMQRAFAKLTGSASQGQATQALPEDEAWQNGIVLTPFGPGYNWPQAGNAIGWAVLEAKDVHYSAEHPVPRPEDSPPVLAFYTNDPDADLLDITFAVPSTGVYLLTFSVCPGATVAGVQPPVVDYIAGMGAHHGFTPMPLAGDDSDAANATHWTGQMSAVGAAEVMMRLRWPTSHAANWAKLTIRKY